ncbi:hypothetical protein C8R45DRAFT_939747 [Mycena sanguinolenta]|nr:hypothetical protein C8R45DRAFT_939747 [Mycena sanguinolenta]
MFLGIALHLNMEDGFIDHERLRECGDGQREGHPIEVQRPPMHVHCASPKAATQCEAVTHVPVAKVEPNVVTRWREQESALRPAFPTCPSLHLSVLHDLLAPLGPPVLRHLTFPSIEIIHACVRESCAKESGVCEAASCRHGTQMEVAPWQYCTISTVTGPPEPHFRPKTPKNRPKRKLNLSKVEPKRSQVTPPEPTVEMSRSEHPQPYFGIILFGNPSAIKDVIWKPGFHWEPHTLGTGRQLGRSNQMIFSRFSFEFDGA